MFSYSTGYYVSPPDDQYLKFKNRCSLIRTFEKDYVIKTVNPQNFLLIILGSLKNAHRKSMCTSVSSELWKDPWSPCRNATVFAQFEPIKKHLTPWFLYNSSTFPASILSEPVFVNLLRSPGIDSQPGGPVRQPYLTGPSGGIDSLGSLNVYKFGLWTLAHNENITQETQQMCFKKTNRRKKLRRFPGPQKEIWNGWYGWAVILYNCT